MIKNYIKIAWRNVVKHRHSSLINIVGLTIGFASFLLIFLVVQYEKSFDTFHTNASNLYRVVRVGKNPINREYRTGVPTPVTPTLRNDYPSLKNAASILNLGSRQINVIATDGTILKKFKEPDVFLAEPQFFQMFDFPLLKGDIKTAISDPNTVLLTKEVASKYFGDWEQAVGNSISIFNKPLKVTGILENTPSNTDFPLGIVISYASLTANSKSDDWASIDDDNYCMVQLGNVSPDQFQSQLDAFVNKYITPVNPGYGLSLQPLNEIHFDERFGNYKGRTFSTDLILALSLIAVFLLIIACVNFINLSTAQAINRAREVGVRKVLGSSRKNLVIQFMGETGITVFLAIVGSIAIAFLCLPLINNLLNIHIVSAAFFSFKFAAFILIACIGVTLLSGFYPAMVLSGFKSIHVLKTNSKVSQHKDISLRRALVVFQFVIAQILIIGTLVVASQMDYFRNADLGYNKTAIINAGFPSDSLSRTKVDFLRNELMKIKGVQNVSFSTFTPTASNGSWATDLSLPENSGPTPDMIINMKPADTSFFGLYGLQIVAGRMYYPSDTMREFVVNEKVVKNLGIEKPQDAIGKMIVVNGQKLPIVGVVKDFNASSLRDPIGPIVMTTSKNNYGLTNIKINLKEAKPVINALQQTWNKYFPDYVFEYSFLDQSIAHLYDQENRLSDLYKIFSGIAILISCLGLYGLISFMAVQKRKEIGIRKVLGAPVRDIVILLSKEFTILIGIAFLIAAPLAWYFMHGWLQQYTYRIPLGAGFFIVTILCSFIIGWITVAYTTIKAAIANPIKSLRTE